MSVYDFGADNLLKRVEYICALFVLDFFLLRIQLFGKLILKYIAISVVGEDPSSIVIGGRAIGKICTLISTFDVHINVLLDNIAHSFDWFKDNAGQGRIRIEMLNNLITLNQWIKII